MKKKMLSLTIMFLVLGFFAGCGSSEKAPDAAGEKEIHEKPDVKTESGKSTTFENDFFTAVIPEGWTVFDDSKVKMMRIYPEKDTSIFAPTIHLKFEGNGNWDGTPEAAISDMVSRYNGSASEKVIINEIEYFKTTYEYSGANQTMLVAKKAGNKITLTLVGKDYDSNPDIPKILDTISYK